MKTLPFALQRWNMRAEDQLSAMTPPLSLTRKRLAATLTALILSGLPASAVDLYWDTNGNTASFGNATGTWGTSAFWNTDSTGGAGTFSSATTSSDIINFGTATLNYDNAATIGVAAGGVAADSIVIGGGQITAMTVGTSGNAITIQNGITKNAGSAAFTIGSPIILGAAQTWTNNSSGTLSTGRLTNLIDNGGYQLTIDGTGSTTFGLQGATDVALTGSGALVKNGSGRLTVGGLNSGFTGAVIINGGVLQAYQDTSGLSLGNGNVTMNGGVLSYYWGYTLNRTLGAGTNQIQILGGESGFGNQGSTTTVNLGGTVVWGAAGEGAATGFFNPTKFVLGDPSTGNKGATKFSDGIDLNGATRCILVPYGTAAPGNTSTMSAAISNSVGTAGLIKEGPGTLILSVANSYNGGTTLQAGTLQLGNNTALGATSGTLTVNSGLLNINNFTVTVGNLTGTGGTIANNGNAARTLTIGSGNGTGGNFQGVIANNNNAGTGALALIKTGSGTITLSGTNTYTGTTTISGGALQIGNGGTSGSLATSALTNNTTLVYDRSDDFSVDYAISGSGALIKQGSGIMTLTTAAAYTGNTTVSAGTLKLNHPNVSNDSSLVTIAETGATLELNFTGTDIVDEFYIGTTHMAYGVYKAIGNPAPGIEIPQITGTGTLNATGDIVLPTFLNIVDNRNGRPTPANTPITYTITFSEGIDESSVTAADFTNAGTAPITIGTITQTTPGVFTVLVTATDSGTLRLKIPAGAVITDPRGNPLTTTSDILDNVTFGIYVPDYGAPQFVGTSPVATNVGSTITLAMPAGAKPGDVLIANIVNYAGPTDYAAVFNSGTGWTTLRTARLSSQNNTRLGVYYRVVTAADPSSFQLGLGYAAPYAAAGVVMAFSNVDTAYGPLDVSASSMYSETNPTAAAGPAPAISTINSNTLLLMLGMAIGDSPVSWSNWATTSLGPLTELYDVNSTGAYKEISLGAAWAEKAVAGTTGTGSASLSGSIQNGSVLLALKPSYNNALVAALTALTSHVNGEIPLNSTQIAAHKATIEANKRSIGSSVSALAAAMDLVRTYDEVLGPLWVARNLPSRTTVIDDIHYTMFRVMTLISYFGYSSSNIANHPDLFNNFSFGSSAKFPGACAPPADPEQVHTALINANYLDSWGRPTIGEDSTDPTNPPIATKPTGTYLAPGSIATITVPASMVGKGYNVRIGAHKTDFSGKTTIARLDQCSISYPITSTTTKVANPLGGGIYIDVPPYITNVGVVSIQIKNAVRSPFFSAKSFHQTTLAEWQNTERNHTAPWADFQSEKVMMQVPTSWIYALEDPVTLMADWDRTADRVNDLMGFPRIRGRESIYNQVDLMISGIGGFTPGWPAVNNTYSPGANYNNGYADQYLVRGPQYASYVELHELGHSYTFPKFPGETESVVNLLHVPVFNLAFGYSLDDAFRSSISGPAFVTLDTTAIAWMMCDNFGSVMPSVEKQYAFKGHAKFVEVARLFGWNKVNKYYYSMNAEYEANKSVVIAEDVDSMLLRLAQNVNSDIRPLFHFWGVLPANSITLGASIQAANLPASAAIYDTLVHYKSLVPPDNAAFQTFANGWWGRQPLITGFTEERNHAARWATYDPAMAATTAARAQAIIDLYFPAGRPSDYGDWTLQWDGSNLINAQGDLDGDGVSNDHERIWGLVPTDPKSRDPIQSLDVSESGTFTYTRRDLTRSGINYTVWTSTDLNQWTEDTGAQQIPGATDANGVQTVQTTLSPALLGNPNLFIKIEATE